MGEKSRGNWNIGLCLRRRTCLNADPKYRGLKCRQCIRYSNYKRR